MSLIDHLCLCERKFCKNEAGMSLLTLVVVIMMFAGFTAATMLAIRPADNNRRMQETTQKADILIKAIKRYKDTNANTAPTSLSQLVTTTGIPCLLDDTVTSPHYQTVQGWCGPYVDQPITVSSSSSNDYQTDGWGTAFQYSGAILKSCGPDKICGTIDDITF
jgi:type II secretory pathway pseudopilin PulG